MSTLFIILLIFLMLSLVDQYNIIGIRNIVYFNNMMLAGYLKVAKEFGAKTINLRSKNIKMQIWDTVFILIFKDY